MAATKDKPSYTPTKPQTEKRQEVFQTPTYKNPPPMPPVKPSKPDGK